MNPYLIGIAGPSCSGKSDVSRRLARILRAHGVYPIGRYGGWTYCSIEDNIVEARTLVASWQ